LWASGEFESCIHAAQEKYSGPKNQKGFAFFSFIFGWWAGCVGHWTDTNTGPITAAAAGLTGIFTFVLACSTIGLWRETEGLAVGADEQSKKMGESIAESARAATAMEGVANSLEEITVANRQTAELIRDNAINQMRAYITISYGQLFYQDQRVGPRIQMDPAVLNVGFTPARRVVSAFKAAILPFPIPDDFDFTIPEPDPDIGGTMHPRQPYTFRAVADEFYTEEDIWDTIFLKGRALYVWGTVWYDDISKIRRFQDYAAFAVWREAGKCGWVNAPRHNNGN
jgi:hypothetical protein